jgi:hypothetical protein
MSTDFATGEILDLAMRRRLPFSVGATDGLHVDEQDLPAWRHAALRLETNE